MIFGLGYLFWGGSAVVAQTITRGPYLQQPTAEGVTIRWRTDVPTDSRVEFNLPDSTQVLSKVDNTPTTEHIVTLTGLPPDTKYLYGVGTSQRILRRGPDRFFQTAPPATTKRPIRFWAMGDFGASDTEKYATNQQAVRDQFLAKKNGPVDLWVWLGDNAYCCGTQQEYQTQVFDFYGSQLFGNLPILPSPGNHEYLATPTAKVDRNIPYYDMITVPARGEAGGVPSGTKAYYSLNYGNIHFISLDTYGYDEGKYPLSDKRSLQYQWLEKDLAAASSLWTIVFFHHPPYTKRSHDSDGEAELRVIRETLVPLFDKYKVDLVLAGHSHVYERSYLMKGHTGLSFTFNKNQHVVQNTEAYYTKDSKPIINKDEGTIYMVIGSAGRLDWNGRPDPHPSSVYSNYQIGGSSIFTVDENRLDSQWLSADGQIRDRFTVFKQVNKRTEKKVTYGASVELTASWKGTYIWSTGQSNVQSVTLSPLRDTLITVSDSLGYLRDTFLLSVTPPPTIKTLIDTSKAICAGQPLTVSYSSTGTNPESLTYKVELSDASSSFAQPQLLAEGKQASFQVVVPATIQGGTGYRVRVVPSPAPGATLFETVPSVAFAIRLPVSARLTTTSPLTYADEVSLQVELNGTLPARLKITSLPEQTVNQPSVEVKVSPRQASVFSIEKLSNVCGGGAIDTRVVEITPPLSTSPTLGFTIYPNPANDRIIIENQTQQSTPVTVLITDMSGKRVVEKELNVITKQEIRTGSLPSGMYLIEVKSGTQSWKKRIVKD
jgi:3',5'-cyclic AMP phosphodiesterase CpdA